MCARCDVPTELIIGASDARSSGIEDTTVLKKLVAKIHRGIHFTFFNVAQVS